MTKKEVKKILKGLEQEVSKAVLLLENAPDSHNCGSFRVKIYWNGETLYHCVQQANSWNPDDTEILSFEYSRPEYDTTQELLDECEFEGTIEEWDWDNFLQEDIYKFIDRLLEDGKENLLKLEGNC